MPLRKAIFPVAGLGTRFLPATKAIPKEMLPVLDKPLIQHAVEEARAAGITEFIFVTGRGKSAIEDHFDHAVELAEKLAHAHRLEELAGITDCIAEPGQMTFLRQQSPRGLGHAVWCARHLIGDEPVAVLLPDDLILARTPCLKQMVEAHRRVGGNLVAVMEVPRPQTRRYGILTPGRTDDRIVEVKGLVEKPDPAVAPSSLAVIGRYILDPSIFRLLDRQKPGKDGEIQLTDALAKMIGRKPVHGYIFAGERFDCGDKLGWLDANLAFAQAHPSLGKSAKELIGKYALLNGWRRAMAPATPPRRPRGKTGGGPRSRGPVRPGARLR